METVKKCTHKNLLVGYNLKFTCMDCFRRFDNVIIDNIDNDNSLYTKAIRDKYGRLGIKTEVRPKFGYRFS